MQNEDSAVLVISKGSSKDSGNYERLKVFAFVNFVYSSLFPLALYLMNRDDGKILNEMTVYLLK